MWHEEYNLTINLDLAQSLITLNPILCYYALFISKKEKKKLNTYTVETIEIWESRHQFNANVKRSNYVVDIESSKNDVLYGVEGSRHQVRCILTH